MLCYIVTTIYLFGGAAIAQQQAWAQFNIPSRFRTADYYSQCVPGIAVTSRTLSMTRTTAAGTTTGASTTLSTSGYYWVQAVASPNFHSYLQAAPTVTSSPGPGDAYLRPAQNAGQFNIVDGQLENNPGSSGGGMPYIRVEDPTDKTQRTLQTWFDTTENPYGKFAFQGDTLTWTVADISRPHAGAWLVCGNDGQL
ncbi:carbohydrate-binding module family 1 protein [Xylaria longipes]|nr:carbohydrate-binding module family 1 protein [Xylaria longipes]